MSTRSFIGIEYPDGKIKGVYCHFDGDIYHNGMILYDYYKNIDKITKLINLGSLSSLGVDIGIQVDFNNNNINNYEQCIAYHRDRSEELCIETYENRAEIRSNDSDYEFIYLFSKTENKWLVCEYDDYVTLESRIKHLESINDKIFTYRREKARLSASAL